MALVLVWDLYKHVNLVGGIKNHKRIGKLQCCLIKLTYVFEDTLSSTIVSTFMGLCFMSYVK